MLREHLVGPVKWNRDQMLNVSDESSPFYGYLVRIMRVCVNEQGSYYYLTLWGNGTVTLRLTFREDQLMEHEQFKTT